MITLRLDLVLLALIAVSCGTPTSESVEEQVRADDTTCIAEIEQAKRDIAQKQFFYCDNFGLGVDPVRAEKELRAALDRIGIGYRLDDIPCVVREGFEDNCYCRFMYEQIGKKFGEGFLDSLSFVADSLYVRTHPDVVYECTSDDNCWDIPPLYPGDTAIDQTNHSGLQVRFDRGVKYPNDYRRRNGNNSMAQVKVSVTVDEHGLADATIVEFIFWDNETKEADFNGSLWNYLGYRADSLVEAVTWSPASIKSIPVKSRTDIFVYFE